MRRIARVLLIALLLLGNLLGQTSLATPAQEPAQPGEDIAERLASAPALFVGNVGQFAPRTRFQMWGAQGTTRLAEDGGAVPATKILAAPQVDLVVSKSIDGMAGAPGEEMVYEIMARNLGSAPAHDVIITDTLPVSTTFVPSQDYGSFSLACALSNTVVFTRSTMQEGGMQYFARLRVRVTDTAQVGDPLVNNVTISSREDDVNPANNSYRHTAQVAPLTAYLSLYKVAWVGPGAAPGGQMGYRLRLINHGNYTATEIILTDTLPANMTFVPERHYGDYNLARVVSNTVVFTTTRGEPGYYGSCNLLVRVAESARVGDELVNQATVTWRRPDGTSGQTSAMSIDHVVARSVDMRVDKWVEDPVAGPGGVMTYTILALNSWSSTAAASRIIVTDTLPPQLSCLSVESRGAFSDAVVMGQTVVLARETLMNNDVAAASLRVRVASTAHPGDILTNTICVSAQESDANPTDNIYTGTVAVRQPLTVTLSLFPGWNLVSLPLAPADMAITQALSSIGGKYDLVYAYDAFAVAPWKKYNVSAPPFLNTLKAVSETQGLWIRASQAVSLTITGTLPVAPAIPLEQGWNLVGYPSQTTRPVTGALASIDGKYDLVYAYDPSSASPWKKYNVAAPAFLDTLKEMGPGWGYWIRVKEDCTWQVP